MKIDIRKSISRTINTAQYENVIIKCDIEISEEVHSSEDLVKLQKQVTDNLIEDYKITEQTVMSELELEEKSCFVKQTASNIESNQKKITLSPEEESEIFG